MNSRTPNCVVLLGALECDLDALGQCLARRGFHVHSVDSLEPSAAGAGFFDGRASIPWQDVDLIVTRLCRCFERPLELLAWLEDVPSAPPVLIVADQWDVHLYLEAMRRGAFDCVGLPLNENELMRIVSRSLEARHLRSLLAGVTK